MTPAKKNEFWELLRKGGITQQKDKYSVIDENKLHILSPYNKNTKYYILRERVYIYLDEAEEDEVKLSKKVGYFYQVYLHICQMMNYNFRKG